MPLKLIYTSAPRLLQAGRSGFGTVAMSRDIPFQAVKLAEECSKFSRQSGMPAARVIYSYRTVRCSDGIWHMLSCVRDAGTDYSGRTNHLAQHLMFDDREASECARAGKTPAGVILGTAWPDHDGFCGWIEDGVHWGAQEPETDWQWWNHYAGSGYCRLNLSSEAALRGAVLVYGKGLERQGAEDAKAVLSLYAESQAGCPDRGWGVTFTTSLEPNDELSEFRWIGVAENSPMLAKVEATGGRVRVTFDTPPPAPRQPQSTGIHAETGTPDAVHGAALREQQNFGQSTASKVHGSAAKPPPLGLGRPARPIPRAPEHAALRWLKDYRKPLAFAVGLLLALLAASIILFPAPPQIEFINTTFPAYTGKPVRPEVRTVPPGREHEVKIEPEVVTKAGETKVTASIEGKLLGAGTNVTRYVTIPPQSAIIEFDPRSLKQTWPQDVNKQVSVFVEPETDKGTGEALTNKVVFFYKSETQDESGWSAEKPRPTGNQTNFEVKARISADANYTGERRAKLVITTQQNTTGGGEVVSTGDATDNPAGVSGNNTQTSETPATDRIVILVPEKQGLQLLGESFAGKGVTAFEFYAPDGENLGGDKLPPWKPRSLEWGKGAIPSEKPQEFSGRPLAYRLASTAEPTREVVEVANGAGDLIKKLFQTGPFYLEKATSDGDKVRLAPGKFFNSQLKLLPEGAYFEVGVPNSPALSKVMPVLQFRCTQTGWEATLPIKDINGKITAIETEQKEAQKKASEAKRSPAEVYYSSSKTWILRNVTSPEENLFKQLQALELKPAAGGKGPTGAHEVMLALLVDIARNVDESVPMSASQQQESNRKSQGLSQAEKPEKLPAACLTFDELKTRLETMDDPKKQLQTAGEWMSGRETSVSSNVRDKGLKEVVKNIRSGLSGPGFSVTMSSDPSGGPSQNPSLTSLRASRDLLENIGKSAADSDRITGELSLVCNANGEPIKIALDKGLKLAPPPGVIRKDP